jgi:hypothetical protein
MNYSESCEPLGDFSIYVIIINVCVSTYISNGVTMAKLDAFYCKKKYSDFKLL